MRRIAIINQKGGVGKTTTAANLGAALARRGQRVVVLDLDPQANLSMYLGVEVRGDEPSAYGVLTGASTIAQALRATTTPGLRVLPSHLDLSGAELELAGAIGRETLLRDALEAWEPEAQADYLLIDCPPSLGLLSVNALAAAREVLIAVQTEFFALQGLGKLVEVVQLLRRRLNPGLEISGLLPCLYDSRLRLAREVLAELRRYFPGKVYGTSIRSNVKLAESPSYSQTIFEYAPESNGARDYDALAREVLALEAGAPPEPPAPAPDPVAVELAATALALQAAAARARESQRPDAPAPPRDEPPAAPARDERAGLEVCVAAPPLADPAPVSRPAGFGAGLDVEPRAARNGARDERAPAPQPARRSAPFVELAEAAAPDAAEAEAEKPAPAARRRRSSTNYGGTHGEDRPHLAGPRGPRGPRGPEPRPETAT
jgi:chromosome partitioning protein